MAGLRKNLLACHESGELEPTLLLTYMILVPFHFGVCHISLFYEVNSGVAQVRNYRIHILLLSYNNQMLCYGYPNDFLIEDKTGGHLGVKLQRKKIRLLTLQEPLMFRCMS